MRNILMTIEYDGSAYSGWQIQPNVSTVQGEIEKAIKRAIGREVHINGTSRTDAGVHALGQRATFDIEDGIPTGKIAFALNNQLPGDIRILEAREMPAGFHARFNAKGKTYRYKMKQHLSSFDARYFYEVEEGLDLDMIGQAAIAIMGTHDFACFQNAGSDEKESTVRTISQLKFEPARFEDATHKKDGNNGYELVVTGDGFLYNMVRIITGTLVDVGRGKIAPDDIYEMLQSRDRTLAGHTAPPEGLYLEEVIYGQEILDMGGTNNG